MIEQRTPEWHEQRKGLITASNVGAILGIDPYRKPDDVMRQMVRDWHGASLESSRNGAIEWGTFNEETAFGQFCMEHYPASKCGFYVSEEYPWLGASPDGLIGANGLLEIKCPFGLRNEQNPVFKSILDQPHYYAQVQIQLLVTGRSYCYFYQWVPNGSMVERVRFDSLWINENLPKLKDFYEKYPYERDNPARHLAPKRREIDTLEARKLIDEYQQLSDAISLANDRKKEVLSDIVKLSGEKDSLICGHNLTLVKKEGAVSYAKVVAQYCKDIDLEPFRGKPTEYWMLK